MMHTVRYAVHIEDHEEAGDSEADVRGATPSGWDLPYDFMESDPKVPICSYRNLVPKTFIQRYGAKALEGLIAVFFVFKSGERP